jgi:pyruvate,water dikinase
VLINAAWGLGENVVQGAVNPDEFYVFKPTLMKGFKPILEKKTGSKEFKMVYDSGGGKMVKNVPVSEADRAAFCVSEEDILTLARWACTIEDHYTKKKGSFCPMDMEWAKDGKTGELFIVQARPETVQSQRDFTHLEVYKLNDKGKVLVSGRSVGEKIASGVVRVVKSAANLSLVKEGDILVTDRTDPDWEPAMKKAAAIVTNRGGRTCHAAIISRELGVPAVVGTLNGTEALKDGETVTVSCAEGDTGHIYAGALKFEKSTLDFSTNERPKTKIMLNVANPEEAFRTSQIPNDGVGLARMEFIISSFIRIHPLALLHYNKLEDRNLKDTIDLLTVGYTDKAAYFIDRLAQGVAMIGAAFYPNDVIVRMSDFKTNEYANLIGGAQYEPTEENPMIGFRGASRYYHERYRDGFALECKAMKKVREEMGLTNVKLMIPFCRTVEEGKKVIAEMEKHGLKRGENALEIYVMCEIPSNVILADEFSQVFDGFSIGSNDLTQLILGIDRDSEIVAPIFDERNPAVKTMIANVIKAARANKRKIGICGQAPSDYPEFAEFLVREGINSISLNPDAVLKTTAHILKVEKAMQGG